MQNLGLFRNKIPEFFDDPAIAHLDDKNNYIKIGSNNKKIQNTKFPLLGHFYSKTNNYIIMLYLYTCNC
jgi:hypothetical protein